jgi:epoxyqueuosine reductase
MGGRRGGEELVRADEIAPVVSSAAGGPSARAGAGGRLRGSGFLKALGERARTLGFDICRIASPDLAPQTRDHLAQWLAEGQHGDMDWMARTSQRRSDPRALWGDARSVVMLGVNYGPAGDPLAALAEKSAAAISVYARNRDYHDVIKGRLKTLAGWLVAQAEPGQAEVKVFVDTAPVMEKPLAQAAGLGWQGKHTNLVSREFGSWLFLGSIFTNLALAPDDADSDHCGACRACLDICPTRAFPAPYQLDARRCISYLTIEHKGIIAEEFRAAIGNRICGCDDCLAVCPWNKFALASREAKLTARDDLNAPPLADLIALDEAGFRARFAGGPIKRIGHARFLRNVLIAIGNSGDRALIGAVVARLSHPAAIARGMAVWALARLCSRNEFLSLASEAASQEGDESVRAEWRAARALNSPAAPAATL